MSECCWAWAQDVVAAAAGFFGDAAGVGLGVGDVAVGGGLGGGQDLHGVHVGVLLAEQHGAGVVGVFAGQDAPAQPLDFLPQRGALVDQAGELGVHQAAGRRGRVLLRSRAGPAG